MEILFATGNPGKVEEMSQFLPVKQVSPDIREIDAVDVEDVARQKLEDSIRALQTDKPVLVEDTGFYVDALDGFPGAKASFFVETAGIEGLLKLLEDDRRAVFRTALAVRFNGEKKVFTGEVRGRVSEKPRGEPPENLPYNQVFIPEGEEKTFAEDPRLIERCSHRTRAAEKLVDWLDVQSAEIL